MMPGVPGLGSCGLVRPEDLAVCVADGNDIVAVRCTCENQAFGVDLAAKEQAKKDHRGTAYRAGHDYSSVDGHELPAERSVACHLSYPAFQPQGVIQVSFCSKRNLNDPQSPVGPKH